MTNNIFCFGNEIVKEDSLAKELADDMSVEGYKFIKISRVEQLLEEQGHLIILDVVKGIDEITILGIDDLKAHKVNTLHDFDLSFFLQLMKKMGNITDVSIIGLPYGMKKEEAKKSISSLLLRNEWNN